VSPATLAAQAIEAPVLEVFASRQGEGVCINDPQIFVRFGGCNLACDYCDTPESIPFKSGRMHSVEQLLTRVDRAAESSPECKTVSLTGGEPLLHASFLEAFIPRLRARGFNIFLETNGTLHAALTRIAVGCDWIAMDFKPASATRRDLWEAHRWFLKQSGKNVFVKLVLTESTTEHEFQRAVALLGSIRRTIPLILQPATPTSAARSIPMERLASWWRWAASQLPDVRILPQAHRLWNIR